MGATAPRGPGWHRGQDSLVEAFPAIDGAAPGIQGVINRVDDTLRGTDATLGGVAAEDRDFYSESGISLRGIARALFSNVRAGGVQQGGSTITQQYAKNAFLSQDRTITRKVKGTCVRIVSNFGCGQSWCKRRSPSV